MSAVRPRVALFATCLVDLFRPEIGFASLKLLEDAGCDVDVPEAQTCCGQPAWNAGDDKSARAIAERTVALLETYDYVVAPSGSCAGMIKVHYPRLFAADDAWAKRAAALSAKTHELTSFLTDVMKAAPVARCSLRAAYHDSCSGLRELGVRAQPRKLLNEAGAAEIAELADPDACCGFGGLFAVKYPEISERIALDKIAAVEATGADTLLGGDLGCLMHIAGCLKRKGSPIKVRHVAEALAGMGDGAPIGERT